MGSARAMGWGRRPTNAHIEQGGRETHSLTRTQEREREKKRPPLQNTTTQPPHSHPTPAPPRNDPHNAQVKKWALCIAVRFFERYGNPRHAEDDSVSQAFAQVCNPCSIIMLCLCGRVPGYDSVVDELMRTGGGVSVLSACPSVGSLVSPRD